METVIFASFLAMSILVACIKGGGPERVAALLFAVAALLSLFVASETGVFAQTEWGLFCIDTALFGALVWLALSADRYWPMWLSSLQLVSVWMHPAFGMSESRMAFAYAVASIIWSYPMLLILVIGSLRHHQRKVAATGTSLSVA